MLRSFVLCCLLCPLLTYTQSGVIKGTVLDKQSETPLVGATVELLDSETIKGVVTDINGAFKLDQIPVGRRSIRVSYIGFESSTIPNIVVSTGKEAVINVNLLESFHQLEEVIVTSETDKDRPLNKLASVSARQVVVDEINRFSGGRGDIGRLASNFAGVSAPDDSRNDIVIRGNSPSGLLWRLEGIPIPSPNHFATLGTTGGPVSAVNPNLLKNSDFFTSAFPAEYGNAIGGVFDLGFRKGNLDDYEFSGQVGVFTGVEASAEGPLGKKRGSFLVAGRVSLASVASIGVGQTNSVPNYGDLSFNIDFGKRKLGNFSLFGILTRSNIEFLGENIDESEEDAIRDEDTFVDSNISIVGLKHQIALGENSFLRTIIAESITENELTNNRFIDQDTPQERSLSFTRVNSAESRSTFSTLFNSKLSNRVTLRAGLLIEGVGVESFIQSREEQFDNDGDGDPDFFTFSDSDDRLTLLQPHIQGGFRLTEKLTLNAGLHGLYSNLNEQFVVEPRASLNYNLNSKHSISLGYGLHNQPVAFPILFFNEEVNGELLQTNRNLDFVTSNQFVLGYNIKIATNWRAKVELYHQSITNAAVESNSSSFSSLTEGANFIFDPDRVSLVSEGTGFNQGIELTLEKFFSKGFYTLLTASLFESRYEGSDGIERNTPFNNQYVVNLLGGREIALGKSKRNAFFLDTRLSFSGGRFFTPVDLEASQLAGFQVLQEDDAFSLQNDPFFRWDLKFGFKLNSKKKKRSHQFFIDLQNVTNRENISGRGFNRFTNEVEAFEQIGFFPDFGYRFQF